MWLDGIANHQLTSIKIGTVGSYAVSQRGPIILIMNLYAIFQEHRTIHSCIQLEHFKNKVDDQALKAGGLQCINTNDGYVFPLDIVNGLSYLKMHPYSDQEFETLPHIILTSDMIWQLNVLDCSLSNKEDWFQNTSDWTNGIIDYPFDLEGNYKYMSEPLDIRIHDLLLLNERYLQDDEIPQPSTKCQVLTARFTKHHHPVYDKLRPYFLNILAETVKHTLNNTTQYACHSLSGSDMYKTHKSPFPACNVHWRQEAVAMDTGYSDTKVVDTGGIDLAQIFIGQHSLVVDVYGMKNDKQFVNSLLEGIWQ